MCVESDICDSVEHHLEHFLRVLGLHRCGLRSRRTFGQRPFGTSNLCISEVVHRSKFDEGGEDEGEADGDEPVHGRGIRDLGKRMTGADAQRRHGEDGGDACNGKKKVTQVSSHLEEVSIEKKKKILCVLKMLM